MFILFFHYFILIIFIDFRDRKGEKEKHQLVIPLIHWLLLVVPSLGIELQPWLIGMTL